ncbi:MAG TPA: dihydroxy-acid dehydratase, partial [Thermoplasmata archaeon]|nr:dihydroxy-acid dehydratase [Thermoplasmata archaeon]
EEDDLIEIDIPRRALNVVGVDGKEVGVERATGILKQRLQKWKPMEWDVPPGILSVYSELATSAADGGYFRRTFAPPR